MVSLLVANNRDSRDILDRQLRKSSLRPSHKIRPVFFNNLQDRVISLSRLDAQRFNSASQLTTTVIGGAFGSLALMAARKRWPFDAVT